MLVVRQQSRIKLVVRNPGVKVVQVSRVGPPGPAGSGTIRYEDVLVISPIQTSIVLSNVPITNSVAMFINGLRQAVNAFSVSGQTVTLPSSLSLVAGDLLSFHYTS